MKIDEAGCAAFPTADNFSQAGLFNLSYENVDMVRHDAPSDQLVVRIVAFEDCVLDDLCDFGFAKVAVAVAGVLVVGDATGDFLLVFFVR